MKNNQEENKIEVTYDLTGNIPDELLNHIFTWLPLKDVKYNVSRVNSCFEYRGPSCSIYPPCVRCVSRVSHTLLHMPERNTDDGGLPKVIFFLPASVTYLLPASLLDKLKMCHTSRWNNLSKDPTLVKDLYFGPTQSTEVIRNVLRRSTSLLRLRLHCRNDINQLLKEIATSCRKINKLKISADRDSSEITRQCELKSSCILAALSACPNLTSLAIKRISLDGPDEFFSRLSQAAPKLIKLNFNHSVQLGSSQLETLVNGCSPLVEDLRIYCLSFNRIGSVSPYNDAPVVNAAQKMNKTLTVLKLNMLGLTDLVMESIATCSYLVSLHLYRLVNVHDDGLILISRLTNLEHLVVTVPRAITISGWITLFSERNIRRLTHLMISNSYSFEDSVMATLSENCNRLTSLSLPGCRKVTNVGLGCVMNNCHSITHLNLFSTKSIVSTTFSEIPVKLPNLKRLVFRAVDKPIDSSLPSPSVMNHMPNLEFTQQYRYP